LVDRETFEAVQKRLAASRWKRTTPQAGGGEWVLSGVVHCGECGHRMTGCTQHARRGEKTYTYRKYRCRGNYLSGRGTCRACAADQEVIVKEVARIIKTAFADPARLRALEEELRDLTERADGDAAKDLARLRGRLADLDRQIPAAARRLLEVSAANLGDAEAALTAMKKERAELAVHVEKVEAAAEAGAEYADAVRGAVEDLQRIEELIAGATPEKVRTLLGRWVEKVTLYFEPPRPRKDGRGRNVLSHIDIDFTAEAAHLLPSGGRRRSRRATARPRPSPGRAGQSTVPG
jgi:site-specific DNA recombinase